MITARSTRLVRVRDLQAFRVALRSLATSGDADHARSRVVLVPTRSAAEQLRRTLEDSALHRYPRAFVAPHMLTRDQWRTRLADAVPTQQAVLGAHDREAVLGAAARTAAAVHPPPFGLRPGLLAAMLEFYDGFKRHLKSVDDFERLATARYEPDEESDAGAKRLLAQTRFLAESYRRYEARLADLGALDEHAQRLRLIESQDTPFRHVIVAIGDRAGDSHGLWKADFDLLARAPGIERIDVLATHAMLMAGFDARIEEHLPGIEAITIEADALPPRLIVPPAEEVHHIAFRDREEELRGVARRIKSSARGLDPAPLHRTAIIFRRPLPYVYLAGQVLPSAGIPYQAFDALPLASEPYAAALDAVFECLDTDFSRAPLVALLRSPVFTFCSSDRPLTREGVAALDRELSQARYLGHPADLPALAEQWTHPPTPLPSKRQARSQALAAVAARVATEAAAELAPLFESAAPSSHLDTLLLFLKRHARVPTDSEETRARTLRARAAILGALASLRDAHVRHDDAPRDFHETAAAIRRWIGQQTFSPRRGAGGIQLLDADAARFGEFESVYLVGLTQAEWPGSERQNIFYRASLLADLGWPPEDAARAADRAMFDDLLRSASRDVTVSTFLLENDTLIEPSPFLEELSRSGLEIRHAADVGPARVFVDDALVDGDVPACTREGFSREWAEARAASADRADARFHGQTSDPAFESYKVSSLDRYLACPFVFFAEHVLRLEEEPDDEETLGPRSQGTIVHDVLQRFYEAWQEAGRGAITPENLPDARMAFAEAAEQTLSTLPESDAALLRTRLLGSPVAQGVGDIALRIEAERSAPVKERLLEFALDGEAVVRGDAGPRRVVLRAIADRIDLLADGTFRLFDYKLSKPPSVKEAVQLPAYAAAAAARLRERDGRDWQPSNAAYIAFGGKAFTPVAKDPASLGAALEEGERRIAAVLDGIEHGIFPPRPSEEFRCTYCAYSAVCRKDIVDAE